MRQMQAGSWTYSEYFHLNKTYHDTRLGRKSVSPADANAAYRAIDPILLELDSRNRVRPEAGGQQGKGQSQRPEKSMPDRRAHTRSQSIDSPGTVQGNNFNMFEDLGSRPGDEMRSKEKVMADEEQEKADFRKEQVKLASQKKQQAALAKKEDDAAKAAEKEMEK
ncbi:hypothetical protein EK21DRAFT_85168 [Setomelanomma holmii]|uniref:Uncharacterized protein n=1 Tax=Setomelanomma holmii TaxID=210430 RepID=A0A9P4LRP5_9PLEO|nr:hypothetical protein EK21DRAFT_85168 [Setomelanomma holmii]